MLEAIIDRFQRRRDMFGILLSFDFLRNVKAFLKKGRTDSLGYGNYTTGAEEFTIHPRSKKSI